MKSRTRWVAALVVVIGLAIVVVYEGPQERESSSTDGPSAVAGEGRRDNDLVVDGAEDALSEAPTAQASRIDSVSGRFAEQPLPPTISMTQALQDLALLPPIPEFAETVRNFASQTDDAPWSEATESRIFGEISQATGLGVSDIQVDCRTTLCRVQLSNPESTPNARYRSLNELIDTFGLETLWLWAAPDSNGNPINLAYLQRGGTSTTQSEAR
jgi:hypothetical protein